MTEIKPQGALRDGWSAEMGDYAICCEWALDGDILLVADVMGAIKAFDSKSGRVLWQQHESHNGSLLTMRVHPDGKSLVTAGQDGRVLILDVGDGGRIGAIDLGQSWIEHTAWSPGGKWFAASCSRRTWRFSSPIFWMSSAVTGGGGTPLGARRAVGGEPLRSRGNWAQPPQASTTPSSTALIVAHG